MLEIRPIQKLEDDLAPARLMLRVYRLLDCQDAIQTDGDFVERIRGAIEAASSEDLMILQNEIFLGIVRERADVRRSDLKSATLAHLLRQATVLSCTALEAYLPTLLLQHLPTVVRIRGRDFAQQDANVAGYLKNLSFSLEEVVHSTSDEDGALFIANKILNHIKFQYLAGEKGVATACGLLGIQKPWNQLAERLDRDDRDLKRTLRSATQRRNDIVHRGDRSTEDPTGEPVEIAYSWALQAVETISLVCHALNELVEEHMRDLQQGVAK